MFYAKKRKKYNHFRHSISELGELGSEYEKQVSYLIFLPVGIGCLIVCFATYASNHPAAFLSGVIGLSYFLSAFFPCDPETPLLGTWKNTCSPPQSFALGLLGDLVENLKAKLIELEEHLFKAETRASYGELDELIADEFTEIGGSGVRFGKKEALERLPSELPAKISASDMN